MHINSAAIDAVGALSAAAGALLEDAEADALAYLDFPAEHRRRIRTNNVRERMNREIKRRSRVAGRAGAPEPGVDAAPGGRGVRRAGRGLVEQALHLARVDAEADGARGARARRERGVAQEGHHDRRDGDGARRHGEEAGMML